MKIFAVTTNLVFTKKPKWLDDFRVKYDKPYDYHITLKQPCYIDTNEAVIINTKLVEFFKTPIKEIQVDFDDFIVRTQKPNDTCLMIASSSVISPVHDLQNQVVQALASFNNYVDPESAEWEQNFKPHITIGRDLTDEQYASALSEIKEDYACRAKITEVILAVVDNLNPEEAKLPKNLTTFKL